MCPTCLVLHHLIAYIFLKYNIIVINQILDLSTNDQWTNI